MKVSSQLYFLEKGDSMSFLIENTVKIENLSPPQGTYIQKMPKRKGTVVVSNLGSILSWVITGKLIPYANNRGSGRISNKTAESAYQGVKGDCLGECTIGSLKGEDKMVLADFHSRLAGFLRRFADGKMDEKELKTVISVRVVEDHLAAYQELNGGDPHKTKHKIQNPDLAYGSIIASLESALPSGCMKMIGNNKWTIISSIIYNLSQSKDRDWSWPKVYQKRQDAMKLANERAGSIVISAADQRRLVEAIKYWYDLVISLSKRAKETDNNVTKIVNNAGFFGFIVCDRMWAAPKYSTVNVMVKKIIRNLPRVQKACPELCRGNRDAVIAYNLQLEDIFKLKKTDISEAA